MIEATSYCKEKTFGRLMVENLKAVLKEMRSPNDNHAKTVCFTVEVQIFGVVSYPCSGVLQ